ncbi:hypothetical protein B0H34DRAFT_720089 [Crassisporium funariophilum]|nr:hypothetical protein B0H34DRAFT_720089 [Crassisporium funariophilum]
MSKTALDSDLYGDIYGDEDNEFAVPLEQEPSEDNLSEEAEIITHAPSIPMKAEEATATFGTSNQDAYRSLPAKPSASSSAQLSYSAQIAKQFSAYQQTPSQERQQRIENSLPQNPRMNQGRPFAISSSEYSTAPGSLPDTIFGKKPSEMHDAGKMFIGGLNWDTTDEGLRDYFSKFGKVDACTIMRDPSGTSRGFAFLTFENPASVNNVVAQEHVLDGKAIDPKRAIPREEHLRNTRYFVGGLSPTTTSESMREFFAAYGKVVDATVMLDRESGRSKGFGFVTYEDASNADQLVGKIGLILDDKQIEVKAAQPRSQRDQNRTMAPTLPHATTSILETYDQRLQPSNMTFPQNQQNPMSMLYQRSMAQFPLAMMNMNPMMGMGMAMNGFNAMGGGMPGMNMLGTGLHGLTNVNSNMGNVGPLRLGVGPVGNFGVGIAGVMGGGPQIGGVRSMGGRPVTNTLGANFRAAGGPGPGPTRLTTTRGQHSFHPYAR